MNYFDRFLYINCGSTGLNEQQRPINQGSNCSEIDMQGASRLCINNFSATLRLVNVCENSRFEKKRALRNISIGFF